MSARAFFFDIDGTLVDSNELHVAAWHEAFVKASREVSAAAIRKQIGKGGDFLIPTLCPGCSKSEHQAIDDEHGRIFKARYLRQVKPFPHATDLLQALHGRNIRIVLASSAKQEELDHYVKLLGIASLLTGAVTSEDVEKSKPAGDIFAVALTKVGSITAPQTLAVGDTIYDIESARRNGIATVALRTGAFTDEEFQKAGAVAIYDDVAAVLDQLDSLLARYTKA